VRDAANRHYRRTQLLTLAATHCSNPNKMQAGLLGELRGARQASPFDQLMAYAKAQKAAPAH
jgi:hypothetical protein